MELKLQFSPIPENASTFADQIVQAARDVSKVELDYSQESLVLVDRILEDFIRDKLTPEQIGETLFGFGCYVGEVFVRNAGGIWKNTTETPMKSFAGVPIVIKMPDGSIVNPVGKVFKCVENAEVGALPYFYHVFVTRKL